MKKSTTPVKTINVVDRLSAPTTLMYELGCVAYATVAGGLILLALTAMKH
jgi:hypothetical protein